MIEMDNESSQKLFTMFTTIENSVKFQRNKALKSFFLKLREKHNEYLRKKIALAKLNRIIKAIIRKFYNDFFAHLKDIMDNIDFDSLPKSPLPKIQHNFGPEVSTFDVFHDYLKDQTPIKCLKNNELNKIFSTQSLMLKLHLIFENRQQKLVSQFFNYIKMPIYLLSQPRLFESQRFSFKSKISNSKAQTVDVTMVDSPMKDNKKETFEVLNDIITSYKRKIFLILKSSAYENAQSESFIYESKSVDKIATGFLNILDKRSVVDSVSSSLECNLTKSKTSQMNQGIINDSMIDNIRSLDSFQKVQALCYSSQNNDSFIFNQTMLPICNYLYKHEVINLIR